MVTVSAVGENHGTVPASPAVELVLSTSSAIAVTDTLLGLELPKLVFMPGESLRVSKDVQILGNLASGSYYIGAIAPPDRAETTPADNFMAKAIALSGGTCTPDAFEDDDRPPDAKPIALAEPQRHDFCDDVTDWTTFDAAAGQVF